MMKDSSDASTSTVAAGGNAAASSSLRPYTSYNFFFQLQREYILQTVHGFRPSLAPSDVFDPADATNYQGPPLPARFRELILPYDWHIPGKAQRRKRSHRKTHGKIGFHELNDQISRAWNAADEETRDFCTKLAESEAKKYKGAPRVTSDIRRSIKKGKAKKREAGEAAVGQLLADPFAWALESPRDLPLSRVVSNSSDLESRSSLRTSLGSSLTSSMTSNASNLNQVDMGDGEILAMWKSIAIHEENMPSSEEQGQVCVEIPPAVSSEPPFAVTPPITLSSGAHTPPAAMGAAEQMQGQGRRRSSVLDSEQGRAVVDNQYDLYRELGRKFSAGSRRPSGLPTELERNVFAASLA